MTALLRLRGRIGLLDERACFGAEYVPRKHHSINKVATSGSPLGAFACPIITFFNQVLFILMMEMYIVLKVVIQDTLCS